MAKTPLTGFGLSIWLTNKLFCDNKVACDVAFNSVQHDHTK